MPTPGQPALKAALLEIFESNDNTADEVADQIATAFDNHVLGTTVIVTGTATGRRGGSLPVTGTGTV